MCHAILHHHDHVIFSSITDPASIEICNWISIVQAAKYIVDSHLDLRNGEWAIWQPLALKYLQLSGQKFDEISGDIVAVLNGD